ncbi:MAG: SsrA-binding protein SmpB [Candidatus Colwellbacteria bacterium]|nr:SsrA-binding protein SmpB [Candidatus Colwellbacteria bacterium]
MAELVKNKKVFFDYFVVASYEAGIELRGHEVKSVKKGQISLQGSYVIVRGNEAFLLNSDIPPYQPLNVPDGYDPKRTRRLLLKKEELKELIGKSKEARLTIVPLSVYTKGKKQLIKVSVGLVRSKRKHDKREVIKKRETEREIRRSIK